MNGATLTRRRTYTSGFLPMKAQIKFEYSSIAQFSFFRTISLEFTVPVCQVRPDSCQCSFFFFKFCSKHWPRLKFRRDPERFELPWRLGWKPLSHSCPFKSWGVRPNNWKVLAFFHLQVVNIAFCRTTTLPQMSL